MASHPFPLRFPWSPEVKWRVNRWVGWRKDDHDEASDRIDVAIGGRHGVGVCRGHEGG